jgi:SMC interacting uncharacterized protein involved in chromosome segregation
LLSVCGAYAHVQVLQERLDQKKELLLEKELMLEEVSNLIVKLRTQALSRREETLELAKRASDFQAKIRETTRRMMALVAELSMYQATALKLQQEKHLRQGELEMAQAKFDMGEPPTAHAEREWARVVSDRVWSCQAHFSRWHHTMWRNRCV